MGAGAVCGAFVWRGDQGPTDVAFAETHPKSLVVMAGIRPQSDGRIDSPQDSPIVMNADMGWRDAVSPRIGEACVGVLPPVLTCALTNWHLG